MRDRRKIFLVDDIPSNLLIAEEVLSDFFHVTSFTDPHKVLKKTKTQSPDIIISDLMMPEMDGIELLKEIKAINPEIIFVAITANHDRKLKTKAMQNGANGYLLKPLNIETFQSEINSIIKNVKKG
jgi:CheY-like chemotaxis protein